MGDKQATLLVPSDADGFASFNCPFCGERFKLIPSEAQAEDVFSLYCPACGLPDKPVEFLSDEAKEAAQIVLENMARDVMNEVMKDLERTFRSSKVLKVRHTGRQFRQEPEKRFMELEDLEIARLMCCGRHVKTSLLKKRLGAYCPYCGGR